MKRTGIFALAATCALGVTALVGGVGYASALDVAEEAGKTLDVAGVSTVDKTSHEVADSTTPGKEKGTPTTEPTDPATVPPVVEAPVDDGTVDQGSGDAVDEVDPSDPVVIPDDGTKDPADYKGCGKGDSDGQADDGVTDPAVGGDGGWDGSQDSWDGAQDSWDGAQDGWDGTHDATAPDGSWTGSDDSTRDGSDRSWEGSDRSWGDGDRRGGGDDNRSDRGGDRGQRGGGHGHGGGGHHGGRG